jgi:hypothetical protein
MKIFKFKKNKGPAPNVPTLGRDRSGFVVLFAVTLSAIFLSIALGVANTSFKEVSFSISSKDSNDAFLAADTGSECALFYDRSDGTNFPIGGPGISSVSCAGSATIPVSFSLNGTISLYQFTITGLGSSSNGCAKISISKDTSADPALVSVTSSGYNMGDATCSSSNVHRVERELVISSYTGATPDYTPADSSVDIKCGGADSCNISSGGTATLTWSTSSTVTDCNAFAGPWTGTKTWPTGSEITSALTSSQTYTIECSGVTGSAQDSVTVTVGNIAPTVTTPTVASITSSGAILGANVTSLGFPAAISARGTCWGTTAAPTTNCVAEGGTTTGVFTQAQTGMSSSTTYYYRGYAINTSGTAYSADGTFTTLAPTSTIQYVGASSAAATTVSVPVHAVGDLMVIFAYRDGSTTAPTIPSGWTIIGSASSGGTGGGRNSSVMAYKIATATNDTSGTWANATELEVQVYRGQNASPIGANGSTVGTSTNIISYPALTLNVTNGTSWVAGFAGHQSASAASMAVAPTGMTNRTAIIGIAGHDTNSGVSTWTAKTVTVSTSASYLSRTLEIKSQ